MSDIHESAVYSRRLIDASTVRARTSLSRTTTWRLVRAGLFPAPVRVSSGRVAWDADAVDRWIAERLDTAGA